MLYNNCINVIFLLYQSNQIIYYDYIYDFNEFIHGDTP